MSVDLTLYFLKDGADLTRGGSSVLAEIHPDRQYEFYCQLTSAVADYVVAEAWESKVIPPQVQVEQLPAQYWFEVVDGSERKRTRNDGWGNRLTFVYAEDFARVMPHKDASPRNLAILSFVKALPPDTPIILYWS